MRLRERCRAENSNMVPAQIDKDEDREDCSVADTSPTRHRYSLLDIKTGQDTDVLLDVRYWNCNAKYLSG